MSGLESYNLAEALTSGTPVTINGGTARLFLVVTTLTGASTITKINGSTVSIGATLPAGTYVRIAGTQANFSPAGAVVALA